MIRMNEKNDKGHENQKLTKKDIMQVIKNPRVWMMAVTVLGFSLLADTQDFMVNMFSKNLGVSDSVMIPMSTLTNYGDDFIMLPIILYVGHRLKSYLKAVIIVGTAFALLTLVVILIPAVRSWEGILSVVVIELVIYRISGFIRSFFWTTRWSQISELNIKKHQYGLVVGIFSGVAFSSEAWLYQIASTIQEQPEFIQGVDKKGNTFANLAGNQLIIGIAAGLSLICFATGLILYLINRKEYIARGKDTYRIISESPGEYYEYDKNHFVKIFSNKLITAMGGADNIAKMVLCSTRLNFTVIDNDRVNNEKINKLPTLGVVKDGNQQQIVMGIDSEKIGNEVNKKINKKNKTK